MAVRNSVGIAIFGQQLNGKGYTVYAVNDIYAEINEDSRDRLLQMPTDLKFGQGSTIYSINRRGKKDLLRTHIYLAFNIYHYGGYDTKNRPTYYGVSLLIDRGEVPNLSEVYSVLRKLVKTAEKKHSNSDLDIVSHIEKHSEILFTEEKIKATAISSNIDVGKNIGVAFTDEKPNEKAFIRYVDLIFDSVFKDYKTIFISNQRFDIDRFTSLKLIDFSETKTLPVSGSVTEDSSESKGTKSVNEIPDEKEDHPLNDDTPITPEGEDLDTKEEARPENDNIDFKNYGEEVAKTHEEKISYDSERIDDRKKILAALEGKIENKQIELEIVLKRISLFKGKLRRLIAIGLALALLLVLFGYYLGTKYEIPRLERVSDASNQEFILVKPDMASESEISALDIEQSTEGQYSSITNEDSLNIQSIVDELISFAENQNFRIDPYFAIRKKTVKVYDKSRAYEELFHELNTYLYEIDQKYIIYYRGEIRKMISRQQFDEAKKTLRHVRKNLGTLIVPSQQNVLDRTFIEIVDQLNNTKTHKVREKQTLQALSKIYGVSVEELLRLNPGLDKNNISIGQAINIRE